MIGRVKTYEAIVKGEEVIQPGVPESFHVLLKELQGLGLSVELLNEDVERFAKIKSRAQEMSATLGAPLNWDDISDEPLGALEIEELPGGELPVDVAGDSEDDVGDDADSADSDKSDKDVESEGPSEDSLEALASEESGDTATGSDTAGDAATGDDAPGAEDEEN